MHLANTFENKNMSCPTFVNWVQVCKKLWTRTVLLPNETKHEDINFVNWAKAFMVMEMGTRSIKKWNLLYKCCISNGPNIHYRISWDFVEINIEDKKYVVTNSSQPIYALAMSGSVILHLYHLNSDEKELMCKPVRHVGMRIEDPVFKATNSI